MMVPPGGGALVGFWISPANLQRCHCAPPHKTTTNLFPYTDDLAVHASEIFHFHSVLKSKNEGGQEKQYELVPRPMWL